MYTGTIIPLIERISLKWDYIVWVRLGGFGLVGGFGGLVGCFRVRWTLCGVGWMLYWVCWTLRGIGRTLSGSLDALRSWLDTLLSSLDTKTFIQLGRNPLQFFEVGFFLFCMVDGEIL